jgi:hypothetical protein
MFSVMLLVSELLCAVIEILGKSHLDAHLPKEQVWDQSHKAHWNTVPVEHKAH